MEEWMKTNKTNCVTEEEFGFYKVEMERRLRAMERELGRTKECHAKKLLDMDDRIVFVVRFMCVGLFLSVVAIAMAMLV